MIYFTAHTFNCVCHCIKSMFRVLGVYNFALCMKIEEKRERLEGHCTVVENSLTVVQ